MQLNLFFHALVMLCGLASVTFVTLDVRPRALTAIAAAVVLGMLAVSPDRLPDPAWVGGLVATLGVAAVMRPGTRTWVAVFGGVLGGLWAGLLHLAGTPWFAAAGIVGALVALAGFLTRRTPDFAPLALREEALFVVVMLGIVVAVAPGIAAGWQSAAVLNLQPQEIASQAVPAWTLLLTMGATGLGGLYTLWIRR